LYQIYEGENLKASRNQYLGTLSIQLKNRKTKIPVTFDMKENGILYVTVDEKEKEIISTHPGK
jgi:molecular chaperone DnaK (HSP70)